MVFAAAAFPYQPYRLTALHAKTDAIDSFHLIDLPAQEAAENWEPDTQISHLKKRHRANKLTKGQKKSRRMAPSAREWRHPFMPTLWRPERQRIRLQARQPMTCDINDTRGSHSNSLLTEVSPMRFHADQSVRALQCAVVQNGLRLQRRYVADLRSQFS